MVPYCRRETQARFRASRWTVVIELVPDLLRVSWQIRGKPQAYALVRSGELPAIKIGGRGVWRVDRKELEGYVDRLHEETAAWTKNHPLGAKDRISED